MGASGGSKATDIGYAASPHPCLPPEGKGARQGQNVTRSPTFSVRPGSGAFGYTVVVRIDVGL